MIKVLILFLSVMGFCIYSQEPEVYVGPNRIANTNPPDLIWPYRWGLDLGTRIESEQFATPFLLYYDISEKIELRAGTDAWIRNASGHKKNRIGEPFLWLQFLPTQSIDSWYWGVGGGGIVKKSSDVYGNLSLVKIGSILRWDGNIYFGKTEQDKNTQKPNYVGFTNCLTKQIDSRWVVMLDISNDYERYNSERWSHYILLGLNYTWKTEIIFDVDAEYQVFGNSHAWAAHAGLEMYFGKRK